MTGSFASSGYIDTPIEQVSVGIWSESRNGARNDSRTRASTVIISNVACAGSSPGRISTNSSPPRRATVSDSRTALVSRCATACSSWSPASWPSVSLIRLKWSKSRNRQATCVPSRCACARICFSRWFSSDRLGKPGQDVVLRELVRVRGRDLELLRALRDLVLERALVVRDLGLRFRRAAASCG